MRLKLEYLKEGAEQRELQNMAGNFANISRGGKVSVHWNSFKEAATRICSEDWVQKS